MNNPSGDGIFDSGSFIKKQANKAWRINGNVRPDSRNEDQVRMTVGTLDDQDQWRNVEITGYAKVLSANSDSDDLD